MKHVWKKDALGEIDIFAYDYGCHNGPVCEVCGMAFCHHCNPECYDADDCAGKRVESKARTVKDEILERYQNDTEKMALALVHHSINGTWYAINKKEQILSRHTTAPQAIKAQIAYLESAEEVDGE